MGQQLGEVMPASPPTYSHGEPRRATKNTELIVAVISDCDPVTSVVDRFDD
jgi:hypothetical protein